MMKMKDDEQTIELTYKELDLCFYELIGARDHDWQTGHNKCRRPWDLAKDFRAIVVEDFYPRFLEGRKMLKENQK